jgi:acrylyl-CoA reductase (NADPH)
VSESPRSFRAFVVDKPQDGAFSRGLRTIDLDQLPPDEVTVRVDWSSVNFKDGLAAREDGRVARGYPRVPGIDLAGVVIASSSPEHPVGQQVVAHGYDLGTSADGGYSEIRRLPADWVVPLPDDLTARDAMAIGTAGFTAAMGVAALETRGLAPADGPVLVTGASGGVGTTALGILAARGYDVWAATGKDDERARLASLGAAGFLTRDEVTVPGKPLDSARWAGAIDAVGGPTLPYILRTLRPGAAVAACGNAGGPELHTTVFPFILRGVALLGMDSVLMPIEERRALWRRLATDLRPRGLGEGLSEVTLDDLEPALDAIVAGEARGRWVVRVSA